MRCVGMLWLVGALAAASVGAWAGAQAEDTPEQVQVDVHVAAEWVKLPVPEGDKAPGRAVALSAVRILRAVDPKTKEPYDASNGQVGCDPTALRREFRLEKAEFLLGEPILVELRVELGDDGEWQEPVGGNYRARGRDDNFLFLMRHEDGTWVGDPYAPIMMYMGGLASHFSVKEREPHSSWLAVQRWCAIERPGKYDLYCFHRAQGLDVIGRRAALLAGMPAEVMKDHRLDEDGVLVDSATGKLSTRYMASARIVEVGEGGRWAKTPIWPDLPLAVTGYAREANAWGAEETSDFAHFKIVVRDGTPEERRAMVERWTQQAADAREDRTQYAKATAARQAIQFAMQDDFLPVIADWIKLEQESDYYNFAGLAMRPSRASTELLLKSAAKDAVGGLYYLRNEKMADVIPSLIGWLADEDAEVRRLAEWYLRKWTGESFGHTWEGEDRERPTLEEGKAMQPAWRAWWAEHAAGFKPKE
jgi:hypothetical protein